MSAETPSGALRGQALARREDPALLTGEADYTDDLRAPRMAHLAVVRSRYGHARIESIDAGAAEAVDGVLRVLTGEDLAASDVPGRVPAPSPPPEGGSMTVHEGPFVHRRQLLARERVRYTGDAVAAVVAEDRYAARQGAEAVEVEYSRLDAVVDAEAGLAADAPTLHDDDAPGNLGFEWSIGDEDAAAEALSSAPHVVSLELTNQRLAPNAMEPRAALAEYDRADGSLRVSLSTQAPHRHRSMFAEVLGLSEGRVRVVAPAVGGGFGSKTKAYSGELLAGWASMEVGRPVKWTATRSEALRTDAHGRAHETTAEAGVDDDGTLLALRADTTVNVGAYLSAVEGPVATYVYGSLLSGQYEIPAVSARVRGVYTNTAPVDAYRGAGRPEACYVVERLVDAAAREVGLDPVEVRRRNQIPADAFPHETAVGAVYDSGDYAVALEEALELAGYDEFRDRQAARRGTARRGTARREAVGVEGDGADRGAAVDGRGADVDGPLLGIGVGSLVESSGTAQGESGQVRFHPDGSVTAFVGTFDHGQGHHTTFAQVVADELGVPYDDVEVVDGDTGQVPRGTGTFGSRSAIMGGNALRTSAGKVVDAARPAAAHHLEADESDVEFEGGAFHVAGAPDRSIGIQEVARRVYRGEVPEGVERGLEATTFLDPVVNYPFGTHVAAVAVDPDTGEVEVERYVAVDDCGEQINPKVVEGQVHGAVAQGVGQARYEHAVYDENGQLATGSLQDYALPKAEHVPEMVTGSTVTPSPTNDLGVKGVGEAGTIAAPPAIVNAVVDALAPLGVEPGDVQMPLTDESVWRAIREARGD